MSGPHVSWHERHGCGVVVPRAVGKVKIEGIKLSCELLAIQLRNPDRKGDLFSTLCRMLAERKINIAFLSADCTSGEEHATCCIAAEDQHQAQEAVASNHDLAAATTFISGVGLVALFPHQASYRVIGVPLSALLRAGIPIFGMASSLSMLTFVTEYGCLEKAVGILTDLLDIPEDHVPLRPQFPAVQAREK